MMLRRKVQIVVLCVIALVVITTGPAGATAGTLTRVSVNNARQQSNGGSGSVAISANGRYVAFESDASNLVRGDANGQTDVFVRDRKAGRTILVSVGLSGHAGNGQSFWPRMSSDGRYVVFVSWASDLVPGDTNGAGDVFLRDLATSVTRRVSVAQGGHQANGVSDQPSISPDGSVVTFESLATNLVGVPVPGGSWPELYTRDLARNTTQLVSVTPSGKASRFECCYASAVSAGGRLVAFDSSAADLVPGDTNDCRDVFVRDMKAGVTQRVSLTASGRQPDNESFWPTISRDGRFVSFVSFASKMAQGVTRPGFNIFVRDLGTHTNQLVSLARNDRPFTAVCCSQPTLAADGHSIAFASAPLGGGQLNIYLRNLRAGRTSLISAGPQGHLANGESSNPAPSEDGQHVAFSSEATNLIANDTNGVSDAFVWDAERVS